MSCNTVQRRHTAVCRGGAQGTMQTHTINERLSYLMVRAIRLARTLWKLREEDLNSLEGDAAAARDLYLRRTNALVLSRASAEKQAQQASVGFCCWKVGDTVQADVAMKGEWATGKVAEVDEEEGYVILDFSEEWLEDDGTALSFRLWDIAAGGAAHRYFKPRWGGPRPTEQGGLDSNEGAEGDKASTEELLANLNAEADGPCARCEACPRGQSSTDASPSLRPCKGDGCNLIICTKCATEEGCQICEGWQP
jgi:hypothetical protein